MVRLDIGPHVCLYQHEKWQVWIFEQRAMLSIIFYMARFIGGTWANRLQLKREGLIQSILTCTLRLSLDLIHDIITDSKRPENLSFRRLFISLCEVVLWSITSVITEGHLALITSFCSFSCCRFAWSLWFWGNFLQGHNNPVFGSTCLNTVSDSCRAGIR